MTFLEFMKNYYPDVDKKEYELMQTAWLAGYDQGHTLGYHEGHQDGCEESYYKSTEI